jgi:hypothetical protein
VCTLIGSSSYPTCIPIQPPNCTIPSRFIRPTISPTRKPTNIRTTSSPSLKPLTKKPSQNPTAFPSVKPTSMSASPTVKPTFKPSTVPTVTPTGQQLCAGSECTGGFPCVPGTICTIPDGADPNIFFCVEKSLENIFRPICVQSGQSCTPGVSSCCNRGAKCLSLTAFGETNICSVNYVGCKYSQPTMYPTATPSRKPTRKPTKAPKKSTYLRMQE